MEIGNPNTATVWITEEGYRLKCKKIDIGVWDMDTTDMKNIAHGIGASFVNIVHISAFIKEDGFDVYHPIYLFGDNPDPALLSGGIYRFDNTNIQLYRRTGGNFDWAGVFSGGGNRGYVMLIYFE